MRTLALLLITTIATIVPLTALAGTGTFGSYIGIDNGSGNAWYGATQPGPTTLWAFDGSDLGDFTVGDSLLISGGELLTWKSDSGDVTGANLYYSIDATGTTPASFTGIGINWSSNSPFNDAAGNAFTNSSDQKWASITSTPDVLSGLTDGDYSLSVYFEASTNEGTRTDNNGGANYVANFSVASASVVPEPAALLLLIGGIAPLALLRRRK